MTKPDFALTQIQALVKKFKSLTVSERKGMNENATRQGYILPLFRALGWNVDNVNEVSPEEKVSRGFVDFSFRIGGIPRFFLETKRASEDLNDPRWVQQAIDYAWTKSVTWALLSDFEGLRVFNAEWKESDPFRAQFLEFNLDTYLTDFDRLWWFSREETLAGRLEREADKVGKRIKRLPVSLNLFDDLKTWRSDLYKSLRGYNPLYSPAQIDEAVLRLLNRLIFIRTAEDRDVEPMRLMPLLRELEDRHQMDKLSAKLVELFRQFDVTYNSELFAPHFSEELYCDRIPLEELIRGLYEKNFVRYNFNALEADVLGTAYEQYLGHVVTEVQSETGLLATASHVDEKRTKRKSQGIYYTPAFVTRYIVQQTVSRWLDEHGYNPSTPPRILDMACGSGSFLIEAFDTLDRFVAKQRNQVHGESDDLHDNLRRLELLQSCIFGVDKDKQAVDVARLNLMLRALHGRQKLPFLANIREGDSLISGMPEELQAAFGDTWQAKKPFNWEKEFPEAMQAGGFDVIIGNPPYVNAYNMAVADREYFSSSGKYLSPHKKYDIYVLFLERAIKFLKPGGRLGFIVPYPVLNQTYAEPIRRIILDNCCIEAIVDFSEYKVFQEAMVSTCILILRKESNEKQRQDNNVQIIRQADYSTGIESVNAVYVIPQSVFCETPQFMFRLDLQNTVHTLLQKVEAQAVKVGDLCYVSMGAEVHSREDAEVKRGKDALILSKPETKTAKPYIEGKEVGRYVIDWRHRYLNYLPDKMRRPKFPELFENEKIIVRMVTGEEGLIATYDRDNFYTDHSYHLCVPYHLLAGVNRPRVKIVEEQSQSSKPYNLKYLLGLVNSTLMNFYYRAELGGGLNVYPEDIRQLPIHRINFANPAEKSAHDEIVKLVEEMLALQKQHQQAEAALEDSRYPLQRRIENLDKEIDQRVYALYGLTPAEIKIIEGR
jgi:type I restriction-modification system DNA methylase subunit